MVTLLNKIVGRWSNSGLIDKSDEDIYVYGLDLLIFTILNIVAIIITSVFINKLIESIILLAVIIPLQSYGGGYHAKTHLRCFLAMYIGWWVVIFILPFISPAVSFLMTIISIPIIFTLAPVPHENVKTSVEHRLKLRKLVRVIALFIGLLSTFLTFSPSYSQLNFGTILSLGISVVSLSMFIAHIRYKVMHK